MLDTLQHVCGLRSSKDGEAAACISKHVKSPDQRGDVGEESIIA